MKTSYLCLVRYLVLEMTYKNLTVSDFVLEFFVLFLYSSFIIIFRIMRLPAAPTPQNSYNISARAISSALSANLATLLENIFFFQGRLTFWDFIKGIVSRGFGTLFLISLDRFEGRNRAGPGLFFILMTFSCLNFKKFCLCGKDPSK
jgi:hypothetical protein